MDGLAFASDTSLGLGFTLEAAAVQKPRLTISQQSLDVRKVVRIDSSARMLVHVIRLTILAYGALAIMLLW